jgi:hypothetical protein
MAAGGVNGAGGGVYGAGGVNGAGGGVYGAGGANGPGGGVYAAGGMNGTSGVPRRESQPAALLSDPSDPSDADDAPRSRRRVGWRKGAEVDEELWPAETFGGVTDEQFWDDLAADKPLATTARTAQPDSGSRRRPTSAAPLPDVQASPPGPRSGRTAVQPAPIATGATYAARQPVGESRRLPPAAAGGLAGSGGTAYEDPLTSPAYSLRPKGAVDGRSYPSSRRSRDYSGERYEPASSQTTETFSLADTQAARSSNGANETRSGGYRPDPLRSDGYWSGSPGSSDSAGTIRTPAYQPSLGYTDVGTAAYRYPEQSYDGSIRPPNTPPYGDRYGYEDPVGSARGPRQPDGTRGYGQPGGGNASSRYAYPPAAGYQGPYDPRGNNRR